MKTNMLKTGIAIIIAIACSYNAFCHSDECQNPSSINFLSQVQLGKEKNAFCHSDECQNPSSNINQRVNPLVDKKDNPQTTDSGWVQKDGYIENALQVGSISFFRYSNDGQYLFTFGSDYTFRKWDVKTGKVVKEKKFGYYKEIKFDFDLYSDESTMILTYSGGGSSETYVYVNDEVVNTIYSSNWINVDARIRILNAYSSIFNNNKTILICLSLVEDGHAGSVSGGSYALWNLDSNKLAYIFPVYSCPNSVTISNNDKYALVASSHYDCTYDLDFHNSELFLINLETYELIPIHSFEDDINFHSLAFSNDSKYCVASKGSLFSIVWDIAAKKVKYYLNEYLAYSKFSMDNKFIITTIGATDYSMIKFYLAESGAEAECIYFDEHIQGKIAVAPDSINIAIAGNDGRIRIFQPKIFNRQLFASFSADSTVKQSSNPVHFKDYSFYNPSSWHWDFGDGETSTEQDPIHYYTSKGIYTVKLIVSNGKIIDTLIRKDFINIHNPVIADFDVIINNDTIPFTAQFINKSKGDLSSYNWNFSYGKISSDENPEILFDKWGEYDVSLKVTDGYFSDSILVSEKIKVLPPTIPFFTNKLEKRFVQNNQTYYGVDGIQTYDGNFVFIAKVYNVETYYYYYEFHYKEIYKNKMLIKMDSVGNIIWEKNVTKGKKIAQLLDSCLIIVDDSVTSRNEIYVAKYNQNGEFLWERFHRTQTLRSDSPVNIRVTKDSGYVIAADSKYYEEYRSSIFKTDKNGIQTMYKANMYGRYTDVIEIEKGYYFLIYHNPNNKNIMISKINESGKVLASVVCGDKINVFPKNTVLIKKSNLIIAGWLTNTDNKQYSYMLKIDSLGNKIWDLIGTTANSQYYSISSISDTLFAATGNFNNQLGLDIINNQGELVNSVRFPERSGVINSIVTTKDNDLFLTGSITPPYKLSQLYTLLLKHPYIITSVEDEQTENTANTKQPFSIFPNPTYSTATLQYKIESPTHLKIELVDFMGTKISEVENSFKEAGEYSSLINFESLAIAKGVYFVRFIANGNVFVSKIIFYNY